MITQKQKLQEHITQVQATKNKWQHITEAQHLDRMNRQNYELFTQNVQIIAENADTTSEVILESVTHILANLANAVEQGSKIAVASVESVSAFLAGVASLANSLPTASDVQKKQNALRVLTAARINPDGELSTAAVPIAELGAKKENLRAHYAQLLRDYSKATDLGKPTNTLLNAIKKLQQDIDRAMRNPRSQQGQYAQASPTTPGTSQQGV